MIKFIALALCAVLVISCAAQVYGGVQHVKSESVKDDQAAPTTAKVTIPSTKQSIPTTKQPIPTTKQPIPTTKAPTPTKVTTVTTAKPTPPHCQPGDRKAVEHSCKEYLECDNQFNWANKTCSTLCKVFEPKSAKCVWNWQFPCMKPPTTEAPPPSPTDTPTKAPATPTTNTPECKEGSVKPIKGNCKDYLTCKSNKWVQTSCGMGYDFDINKLTCTWSWWAKC